MKIRTVCAGVLLTPCVALALQVIEPVEGVNSFVKISAKETTRLAVENGKIASLIMSDGDLYVEKDADRGQMFIRPLVLNKPINVRALLASGATYNLVMQAVDVPQEDVIIRDSLSVDRSDKGASAKFGRSPSTPLAKSVRNLVAAMAQESTPMNVDVRPINQEMALWEGTKFVLLATYTDMGMVGEKYRLTNVSQQQIRLVEQELYRKGVIAVAIENMQLDPRQSTNIYVIRSN